METPDDLEVTLYDYSTGENTVVKNGDRLTVEDSHYIMIKAKNDKLFSFEIRSSAGNSQYWVTHKKSYTQISGRNEPNSGMQLAITKWGDNDYVFTATIGRN